MHQGSRKRWDVPDGFSPHWPIVGAFPQQWPGGLHPRLLRGRRRRRELERLSSKLFKRCACRRGGRAGRIVSLVWYDPVASITAAGFTPTGLLGLPILFAARGFLLAFSIASFVRLFGSTGCLLAFLVFGITGAVAFPALFVLGVQSLLAARVLASRFLGRGNVRLPTERPIFCAAAGVPRRCVCVCCWSSWSYLP